ncbi:MAG: hypothetical protein GF390_01260 [Candidatus Pacebacteria bacterium]|nr:hypothetical protein [Candidatus Paceibacterota bacterium]
MNEQAPPPQKYRYESPREPDLGPMGRIAKKLKGLFTGCGPSKPPQPPSAAQDPPGRSTVQNNREDPTAQARQTSNQPAPLRDKANQEPKVIKLGEPEGRVTAENIGRTINFLQELVGFYLNHRADETLDLQSLAADEVFMVGNFKGLAVEQQTVYNRQACILAVLQMLAQQVGWIDTSEEFDLLHQKGDLLEVAEQIPNLTYDGSVGTLRLNQADKIQQWLGRFLELTQGYRDSAAQNLGTISYLTSADLIPNQQTEQPSDQLSNQNSLTPIVARRLSLLAADHNGFENLPINTCLIAFMIQEYLLNKQVFFGVRLIDNIQNLEEASFVGHQVLIDRIAIEGTPQSPKIKFHIIDPMGSDRWIDLTTLITTLDSSAFVAHNPHTSNRPIKCQKSDAYKPLQGGGTNDTARIKWKY